MNKQQLIEIAKRFAGTIIECIRRNDYGGTYQQALHDWEEVSHAGYAWNGSKYVSAYYTAAGRKAKKSTAQKTYGIQ